jgi:hypothetical protein
MRDRWNALKAMMIGALAIGATASAVAQDFGSVTLQPGQMQAVRIISAGQYRVCNDLSNVGTVEVTIVPRDLRSLQPGGCTEESGWEIHFSNRSTSPAMVDYRRLCAGRACND